MAEILIADEAGACYGVERALQLTLDVVSRGEGPVYTLGPLIHNPQVVSELEALGVHVADDVEQVPAGSVLVLRTHGVAPELKRKAHEAGATVVDATCPFVMRAHRAAERLVRDGYQLLIIGEAGHAEVEGTLGHAPHAVVVGGVADLTGIELARRVGLVVQTTQSEDNVRSIVSALIGKVEELLLVDTVCEATAGHQAACARLAGQVDVMVVIGGHNSANTTHLAAIAREHCARTHHIERADELDASWFVNAGRIGVTAGASTPGSHIEMVCDAIRRLAEQA